MKPIRVLLIGPTLDIIGGHSIQADRLLRGFESEPSVDVRFLPINPRWPGPFRALQKIKYVRTLATSVLYGINLLAGIWRADVLHIFTPGYFAFYLAPAPAILLAKLIGKKTILNYHDGRAADHLSKSPMAAWIMRRANVIVTPSNFLVEVFARFGLKARSIFNIVATECFRFRERTHPRPIFLHNRGLAREYNVGCTLRAFALVQERYPDASLTVSHDGPMRNELEALAQSLGLRNTRFIGHVAPEQMAELYDEADIYLTSPEIDNMPLSLLECFASGLPVVSSNVGGVPYILETERTGLLFRPDDHKAMAACAIRLLEEEGLAARLARNAREECVKYSWERAGREWVDLYHEVADRRSTN